MTGRDWSIATRRNTNDYNHQTLGGIEMIDTPRTDAAITDSSGRWCFELRDVARELERELNEANADRQRLRDALTQAGAGQFLDTISATPPPPVVAKADADALAVAMTLDWQAIREALKTYRTKYPTT
jgi:hypothetical protein